MPEDRPVLSRTAEARQARDASTNMSKEHGFPKA